MRAIVSGERLLHTADLAGDRVVLEIREIARVEHHLDPAAEGADVPAGWTATEDGLTALGPLYVLTSSIVVGVSFDHADVIAQDLRRLAAQGRAIANGLEVRPDDG